MIEIDRLPIADITEQHLVNLVTAKAAEGRILEFKQDLKIGADGDKREFCTDVASFANGAGGIMLHGIKAEKGIAIEVVGIDVPNPDGLVLQVEQILYSGISPRFLVGVRAIPLANGRHVVAIKIPRSIIAPHAVGKEGTFRFFTRGTNGKLPMDIPQVRSSFLLSEGLRERLRAYRAERIGRIIANEGIVPLQSGHKLVLHVIPLASLAEPTEYDVSQFQDFRNPELVTMGVQHASRRDFNLDGIADIYWTSDEQAARGYMQLNQNGIIEAVDAGMVFSRTYTHENYNNSISGRYTIGHLIAGIQNSIAIHRRLGVDAPIYVMVSMLGMRGLWMWHQNYARMPKACDRNDIYFPEVAVLDLAAKVVDVLRPTCNALWRAFGCADCYYYGADGVFRFPD